MSITNWPIYFKLFIIILDIEPEGLQLNKFSPGLLLNTGLKHANRVLVA